MKDSSIVQYLEVSVIKAPKLNRIEAYNTTEMYAKQLSCGCWIIYSSWQINLSYSNLTNPGLADAEMQICPKYICNF